MQLLLIQEGCSMEIKDVDEHGNGDAQYKLGRMYYRGIGGVPQDCKEALNLFTKSAEQGIVGAQYELGLMYTEGIGVPEDYVQAYKWLSLAIAQGNKIAKEKRDALEKWMTTLQFAEAQHRLGLMYYNGVGVPQDYKEAFNLLINVAEQGFAEAQYNIGMMYHNGECVKKDYVQAYKWWNLATSQGSKNGQENKNSLKEKMTPSQIADGQRLSGEFVPKK